MNIKWKGQSLKSEDLDCVDSELVSSVASDGWSDSVVLNLKQYSTQNVPLIILVKLNNNFLLFIYL
jgi:hypothetical protein